MPTSGNVASSYQRTYQQTSKSVGRARCDVVEFARARGFSGQELADVEIAVGEGLANAFEHGHRDGTGFEVRVDCTDGVLVIEIKDDGSGFEPDEQSGSLPPVEALRGFGMFIMRELMDEIVYSERGTRLRMLKRRTESGRDSTPAQG